MPDYASAKQLPLSALDEADRFVVHTRIEIRKLLLTLARKPDILTAYFSDGRKYLLTAVLDVLDDRGLLVLDFGPDTEITRQAIASDRLVCTTRHDGVPVRFSCEGLQSARFKGMPAIATPLPEEIYRRERRDMFRVATPKISGPVCLIERELEEKVYRLAVINLSSGGLAMSDPSGRWQAEEGELLQNCKILLPEYGEIVLQMMVRNKVRVRHDTTPYDRYGVSFEVISPQDSAALQRYIFHLQAQQPR